MRRYVNRDNVHDYVATTLPYASFDSHAEWDIDGIVDTVIESIPDLIGEHDVEGIAATNIIALIDSMIEDEDAYWSVVADHRIHTSNEIRRQVLAQLQREMDEACAVIAHAETKAAAAERHLLKLRAEYDGIAAGTDLV